jgi:hypothetical protein
MVETFKRLVGLGLGLNLSLFLILGFISIDKIIGTEKMVNNFTFMNYECHNGDNITEPLK